jgi:endonuclease YncB( thermonuclease family)
VSLVVLIFTGAAATASTRPSTTGPAPIPATGSPSGSPTGSADVPTVTSATGGTFSTDSTISTGAGPVVQYGAVVYVADGDTIDVAIDGAGPDPDGDGRPGTRVRFLATQAMELHTYHRDLAKVTGECHAPEAARRLKQLLSAADGETGRRVRLSARDASSSNLGRSSRFVATKGTDGAWHDVGAVLVREGQVIPSYQQVEYTRNAEYRRLSEAAAAAGVGIWDTDHCGRGPAASLSVSVRWDAPGNDKANVDGEYVRITNRGRSRVSLARWWVRDSGTRTRPTKAESRRGYTFPAGAAIAAGRSVLLHVGRRPSPAKAGHYYYGLAAPIFENTTAAPTYLGDGSYLFDPQGDLRAWQQYPCVSRRARACRG